MSTLEKELEGLLNLQSASITFGIHADEGAESHGAETVAEIASKHEFGLGVPQRSWLRGFVSEEQEEISNVVEQTMRLASDRGPAAYDAAALILAGKMQARFAKGIGPELAPATVAAKGSSLQLVDTGVMRSSITGKVSA